MALAARLARYASLAFRGRRRGFLFLVALVVAVTLSVLVIEIIPRATVYQLQARTQFLWLRIVDAPDMTWSLRNAILCIESTPDIPTRSGAGNCGSFKQVDLASMAEPLLQVAANSELTVRQLEYGRIEIVLSPVDDEAPFHLSVPPTGERWPIAGRLILLTDPGSLGTYLFVASAGEFGRAPGPAGGHLVEGTLSAFEGSSGGGERYLASEVELAPGDLARFRLSRGSLLRGFFAAAADRESGIQVVANAISDGVDVDRSAGHGYRFTVSLGDRFRSDPFLQWLVLALGIAVSIATIIDVCFPVRNDRSETKRKC